MTDAPTIRPYEPADFDAVDALRADAFAPVFDSMRATLGADLAPDALAYEEREQHELLRRLLEPSAPFEMWVMELEGAIVGFVSVGFDDRSKVGEIGLNAVAPAVAGRGLAQSLYDHAFDRMRARGMVVASVSTGGDAGHAPARRAYEKAGFVNGVPSVWLARRL